MYRNKMNRQMSCTLLVSWKRSMRALQMERESDGGGRRCTAVRNVVFDSRPRC